jgi:hypothetical protein
VATKGETALRCSEPLQLTALGHEQPQVFGVLEAALQQHDLLLVRLGSVVCVHLRSRGVLREEIKSILLLNTISIMH